MQIFSWILHDGLHDLAPVEGLDALRVLDVTGIQPFLDKILQG